VNSVPVVSLCVITALPEHQRFVRAEHEKADVRALGDKLLAQSCGELPKVSLSLPNA
jgi:hypothetical protein